MALTKRATVFDDEAFLEALTVLVCKDPQALSRCADYLTADDFKPLVGDVHGRSRWIIAERALSYYAKHHMPIGRLLTSSLIDHTNEIGLGAKQTEELLAYAKKLLERKQRSPDSIVDSVVRYKSEIRRARAIDELIELQSSGELSNDRWMQITHDIMHTSNGNHVIDYFASIDSRIERRRDDNRYEKIPYFLIGPLDERVRGIGPGNLGMFLAPYKRGKSLMLLYLAFAFSLQRLKTLYVTMEDPLVECEDRLDSMISALRITELALKPKTLQRRLAQIRRIIKNRLLVIDKTEGGASVHELEQLVLQLRDRGIRIDALLVDYDEELSPSRRFKERRLEFDEIYRDLRRLAARHSLIIWTASQTSANTQHLKIIRGDLSAEDKSKVRKVAMAIGMGAGDFGPDSLYLWVAAHKFDKQHLGCNIVSDKECMLIYDQQRTRKAELEARTLRKKDDDAVS